MQQSRQGGGQLIREGPGKADSSAGRRACGEAAPDEAQVAPEKHVGFCYHRPALQTNEEVQSGCHSLLRVAIA